MDLPVAFILICIAAVVGHAIAITNISNECKEDRVFTIGDGVDKQEFICLEKRKP